MSLLDFSDPRLVASSQKYWFHGIALASIAYGGNITLFILCLNLLLCRASSRRGNAGVDRTRYRWSIFLLCYTILNFGLATVSIVLEIMVEEKAFSQPWAIPGAGPSSYLFDNVFGNVTILRPVYVILVSSHLFSTGLLAWRCLILYQASLTDFFVCRHVPGWVVVMVWPFCLLCASLGLGIIFVIDAVAPEKLPSVLNGPPWVIIWGGIAITLSWTLTGLIILRLLMYYWNLRGALGNQRHIKYIRLIAIFTESAGLLSLYWVVFIVVFFLKSPALVMLPFPLTQVQVLCSLLTLYQVTCGNTCSKSTLETLPMPDFADTPSEPSRILAGHEGRFNGEEAGGIIEIQTGSFVGDADASMAEGLK